MNELRKRIMANRDDLIEGTFCHALFENGIFNSDKLDELLNNLNEYIRPLQNGDKEVHELLVWIVGGVEQCFTSHHDSDDLFSIKNYSPNLEKRWRAAWKAEMAEYISLA